MIEVINTEFYPLFCLTKDGGYELNYEVIFWNTIMILKGAAHIFQIAAGSIVTRNVPANTIYMNHIEPRIVKRKIVNEDCNNHGK